ncbi:MAG TPA: ECF-type sigma factor [Gemmatimonadales bacterium]|nr:ECF-type sigma factor [Gemmatimonadales bacterium]
MAAPLRDLFPAANAGDPAAIDALFGVLYRELHLVAERQLHQGSDGLTLGTTTLLHEAYLRLSGSEAQFVDRAHFLGYAARAMRSLVIDYARRRQAKKRGGEFQLMPVADDVHAAAPEQPSLSELGSALDQLAAADSDLAQLVDLHFFCGFSFAEIAELRGLSERTVQRDWRKARLLLHSILQER